MSLYSECERCGHSERSSNGWKTRFDEPWNDDYAKLICPDCTDELREWWE